VFASLVGVSITRAVTSADGREPARQHRLCACSKGDGPAMHSDESSTHNQRCHSATEFLSAQIQYCATVAGLHTRTLACVGQ